MERNVPKPKCTKLHLILVNKGSSGSSGRHLTIKSKHKIKKIMKQLHKKGFYEC